MGKLTDTKIKALKPEDKEYSKHDGNYLYITVTPKGKKNFKVIGKFENVSRKYSIGRYPDISLKEAREIARDAVAHYRQGVDYKKIMNEKKEQLKIANANSFSEWVDKWLTTKADMSAKTLSGYNNRLNNYILPYIRNKLYVVITNWTFWSKD